MIEDRNIAFDMEGYLQFDVFRSNFGGGVKVYCSSHLDPKIVTPLTFVNNYLEIVCLTFKLNSVPYYLMCIYRPPMTDINSFNEFFFEEVITKLPANAECIMSGDFNINLFNPLNLNSISHFYHGMLGLGYFPVITVPTRISPENNITKFSLIDHIWCNVILGHPHRAGVIDCALTDHLPVYYIFSSVPCGAARTSIYRVFSERNIAGFKIVISNTNFQLCSVDSPGETFSNFVDKIMHIYNQSFPLLRKKQINRTFRSPWITDEIKFLIKKKYKLLKLFRRNIISRSDFTTYRNLLTFVIKKSKSLYHRRKILECGGDSRRVWGVLNGMIGRCRSHTPISITSNGNTRSDLDAANDFNEYFSSIGRNTVSALPPADNLSVNRIVPPISSCYFYPTSIQELHGLVTGLKTKRCNKEGFQPFLLHHIFHFIGPTLVGMFNRCLLEGTYPDVLKRARVVPIFKDGDTNSVQNYRPISTLSVFNKLFEKIIHYRLTNYFSKSSQLSPNQFGFRKKSSTTLAIINLLNGCIKSFHKNLLQFVCFWI